MTPSPDLLKAIVAATRKTTEARRQREPQAVVERRSAGRTPRGAMFEEALRGAGPVPSDRPRVIAECKRRSPSRGVLAADYDPVAIATQYERGGAAAISCLTEPSFFDGALEHLTAVRAAVGIPVLRKDFIVEPYQLIEARAAGADAALLIVAALTQDELVSLQTLAWELGLAALIEVHDDEETRRATDAGARIVGVNNRNLRTLSVDTEASYRLAAMLPKGTVTVSESGLKTRDELEQLSAVGYQAFLIGERFMTDPDPASAIRELIGNAPAEAGHGEGVRSGRL